MSKHSNVTLTLVMMHPCTLSQVAILSNIQIHKGILLRKNIQQLSLLLSRLLTWLKVMTHSYLTIMRNVFEIHADGKELCPDKVWTYTLHLL